jgi:hypothetical protein
MKIVRKSKKKLIIVIIVVLLVVSCIFFAFYRTILMASVSNNFTSNSKSINTTNHNNSTENTKPVSSGISSSKEPNQSTPKVANDVIPAAPLGNFVSNHHPNMSGSPSPNREVSTCTTTPGATCLIQFTENNNIKSLNQQTTDANGNTSWAWTLQDAGLTVGKWKITAIANNGDKTSVSSDAMYLEISE